MANPMAKPIPRPSPPVLSERSIDSPSLSGLRVSRRRTVLKNPRGRFRSRNRIGPVEIVPFSFADGLVAVENLSTAFKTEDRLPAGAPEGVRHHAVHVSKDEPRVVAQHGWEMADLHPALSLP